MVTRLSAVQKLLLRSLGAEMSLADVSLLLGSSHLVLTHLVLELGYISVV